MSWLALLGIVVFFLGLQLSIGLHELGHLVPAKLFGVRVSQWMVGFGPTMWSRRRGETEYGVKWLPFGGYNRMVGMLPPRAADGGRLRSTSTGPFQGLVDSARQASMEELGSDDADRCFYSKPWWQKVIIMAGGPAMNVVLAMALFAVVFMGFGVSTPQPTVAGVSQCVVPASAHRSTCGAGDPVSPAARAGLRSGDRIEALDGSRVRSWDDLNQRIRKSGAGPVTLDVARGGQRLRLTANLVLSQRAAPDDPERLENVGFLGISPRFATQRTGPGAVASQMWDFTTLSVSAFGHLPQRLVGVWHAAFSGQQRSADSPVGIVGATRIGGEIASADIPVGERIASFIALLASFNLAVALFNLVPLLPLDGGHIAGALWEGLRRMAARIRRRPDPGYVDVAKALPVAYAMAVVIVGMGALLLYADVVNPVRLPG